jgi:glycosyltransferase involved in cell wall biosynthesis
MEQLITVIVAAYNAEKTIGETLHSVRAQTYRTLEILVVDDGSVDATSKIVEEHIKADSHAPVRRELIERFIENRYSKTFISLLKACSLYIPEWNRVQ